MRRSTSVVGSAVLAATLVVSIGAPGRSAAANAVADPGFESGGTAMWKQCGTRGVDARITTALVHRGTYAMRAGSTTKKNGQIHGNAGLCQAVKVPQNGVLAFWIYGVTTETSPEYSYQEAEFLDDNGDTVKMLWQDSVNTKTWARKTVDVSEYAGRTLRLYFGVHGNGFAKTVTTLYVDDVELRAGNAPPPTAAPTATTAATPAATVPPAATATPAATAIPTSAMTPAGTVTPTPSAATPTPGATATPAVVGGAPTPIPAPAGGGPTTCGNHCGTERWHVKTMSDPFASQVQRSVQVTTVDTLIHAPVPTGMSAKADNIRFAPWELQAVQIRAAFVGWKTEADNDFHIVVADMNNPKETMIVEPPSSACSSACSSGYGALFEAARNTFTRCLGAVPAQFSPPAKKAVVVITGVPMFDVLHGQTGVAPNGIEIHPVLSVVFESGC